MRTNNVKNTNDKTTTKIVYVEPLITISIIDNDVITSSVDNAEWDTEM